VGSNPTFGTNLREHDPRQATETPNLGAASSILASRAIRGGDRFRQLANGNEERFGMIPPLSDQYTNANDNIEFEAVAAVRKDGPVYGLKLAA
jgi:hypothetical protein